MKVLFIAKTNLNNDGRILNEIKILQNSNLKVYIDFILLPDIPLAIDLGDNLKVHTINPSVRHNKIFRFFTVVEFTIRSLMLIFKLKPEIIHVQDSAVVLPVLIYRILQNNKFKLIYDDHEIPNENSNIENYFNTYFEVLLMKRADHIVFANEERMVILKERYKLKSECSYFLNLPYYEDQFDEIGHKFLKVLYDIDSLKDEGYNFIIHQGVLGIQRGRNKLADFSKILPAKFKILLLGGTEWDFNLFLREYNLDENNFYFVGNVNYWLLPRFWEKCIASIVIYLPTYINNRLCAPNRFYLSIEKGLPVIVNKDNPVLSNFVNRYNCGFYIEDFFLDSDFNKLLNSKRLNFTFYYEKIRKEQIDNFILIYQ